MVSNSQENFGDTHQTPETKWKSIKEQYRQHYPSLTEEDTDYRVGEFDDMTHRIARRTNRSREQILENSQLGK